MNVRAVWVCLALILSASVPAAIAQRQIPQFTEHVGFNVTAPPLDNLLLRQALSAAIDRRAVFEAIPRSAWSGGWTGWFHIVWGMILPNGIACRARHS